MRHFLAFVLASGLSAQLHPGLSLPPSGGNQKASVTQYVGPVRIQIDYSSPAVHGPASPAGGPAVDRRGKIWGQLVPYGMTDQGFGASKAAPWRAGANEGTVFSNSHPIELEGQPLPAGKYGLNMLVEKDEWTLILNKDPSAWGTFFYKPEHDVLRVKLKPGKNEYREYLTYDFPERKPTEAVAQLAWEDLAVRFRIKVPNVNEIYLSRIRAELSGATGFVDTAWNAAAQFCLSQNINLEEALTWSDYAISAPFVGRKNFANLSTKAQILSRLKRDTESAALMKEAIQLPGTTVFEVHQYGRQLLAAKKNAEALAVFDTNHKRFNGDWPTKLGLARAYAALGEKQKALDLAKQSLPEAPDPVNKKGIEDLIKSLE
jgi:tetratricopeptide (TPR) repeat protein